MKTQKDDLDDVPTLDINTIEKEVEDKDEEKIIPSGAAPEKRGKTRPFRISCSETIAHGIYFWPSV